MNVQLLLLVALAGPFCAFTHASPTELPSELDVTAAPAITTEANEGTIENLSVNTDPPATKSAAAPEVHTAEVITAAAPVTEVNTEAAVVETEAPPAATEGPEPFITDQPVVATLAPTVAAKVDNKSEATAAAKTEADDEVVVEDEPDGLSSGQVVGIVIGALLAVVIVIAVVIAVVRRMGKYSP
ncbi:podoplanin isoform X2 [Epinephelus lanceolatus]|uniref:podoplanin isoform X2 n=1 Tax=Epinephelus lanceolatus TaxID=310571 RepID=UPI001444BDA0|nr:podoplanin isoform X2 [Epinephelus lanceolatus]